MSNFTAHAPGKIILFGEHAVVYGKPAIAVPVNQIRATVRVIPQPEGVTGPVRILAPGINLSCNLEKLNRDHPLAAVVGNVISSLGVSHLPACTIEITSTIPVAAGLGSGAAVSVAIIRALGKFLGQPIANEQVSALTYQIEKFHHGTPSGIDNTVITYAKPVYFVKQPPSPPNGRGAGGEGNENTIETFNIAKPFTIIIGDTGISSPTKAAVSDVRVARQADPARYERLFAAIGSITKTARQSIESGRPQRLGALMNENHALLQEMGVSSPQLDQLVSAACQAGALGAKLSGGGRGGNMIALVREENAKLVCLAIRKAGAVNTITTEVRTHHPG
ncbi:MAG: mevalonate kinase [Chloroflexota bacterium]|nr:mevalonate kinase [Chloroflexota bacterium]